MDTIATKIKSKYSTSLYLVLLAKVDDKVYIKVWGTKNLCTAWGGTAKTIIAQLAQNIGGKGGGSETYATAIGPSTADIAKVLELAKSFWKEKKA